MILTRSLLSSSCPNEVSATQACACIKHVIGFPSSAGTRITTRAFFGAHSPRSDTTEVEQISISAISIVLAPCIADGALCSESNTQGSDRHHKERDSPARPFGDEYPAALRQLGDVGGDAPQPMPRRAGHTLRGGGRRFCHVCLRPAVRNRKYFKTNSPSRPASGPPQTRHAISPSALSGPASARMT